MTEQTEASGADEPVEMPEQEIEFQGRRIWVRIPRPEQLLVWQRTLRQLQGAETASWNASQVMAALERARKIIDSVLANQVDKDWLDDQMLEGTIGFRETSSLIHQTVQAFADAAESDGNRETRRATKKAPAKKAVRKKASPAT